MPPKNTKYVDDTSLRNLDAALQNLRRPPPTRKSQSKKAEESLKETGMNKATEKKGGPHTTLHGHQVEGFNISDSLIPSAQHSNDGFDIEVIKPSATAPTDGFDINLGVPTDGFNIDLGLGPSANISNDGFDIGEDIQAHINTANDGFNDGFDIGVVEMTKPPAVSNDGFDVDVDIGDNIRTKNVDGFDVDADDIYMPLGLAPAIPTAFDGNTDGFDLGDVPSTHNDGFDLDIPTSTPNDGFDISEVPLPVLDARLADLDKDSSGSHSAVSLEKAVEEILSSDRPHRSRPWLFDPPPEAKNKVARNVYDRYYAYAHPLIGDKLIDDSRLGGGHSAHNYLMDLDAYDYPFEFRRPFESHFTREQLKNLHDKVVDANLDNPSYKDRLYAFKGARLNQLNWEVENVRILKGVENDLHQLEEQLKALL